MKNSTGSSGSRISLGKKRPDKEEIEKDAGISSNREKEFYEELYLYFREKGIPDREKLNRIKNRLCRKHRLIKVPTNIEILLNAPDDLITELGRIRAKPTRSLSGVSVVAVMTRPHKCPHGKCITCPGGPGSEFGDVPQSYTGKEPATRRAIRNLYDPYLQVFNRLEQYVALGHSINKIELIIMGGTFPSLPAAYQDSFIRYCFKAMNDFSKRFFSKGILDLKGYKSFFELPGDLGDKGREKRVRERIMLLKGEDMGDDELIRREIGKDGIVRKEKKESKAFQKENKSRTDKLSDEKEPKKNLKEDFKEGLREGLKEDLKEDLKGQLKKEQKTNEAGNIRCVSLVLETRPDHATLKMLNRMLRQGVTKVELGVQSPYNRALKSMGRGHTVEDSVRATALLKDLGFKINYHIMPGLPGISYNEDLRALRAIVEDSRFMPDMLKIYPCMVLKGTALYDAYKAGRYKPLDTERAARLIAEFKRDIPPFIRIMRVQRDIPSNMVEAGVDRTNLRQYIIGLLGKDRCNCIRCREAGRRKGEGRPAFNVLRYSASGGDEFFISLDKGPALLGFCRMRFPKRCLRQEITPSTALIRELHVYGKSERLGTTGNIQHKGYGMRLLRKAESIAAKGGRNKIVVISGIGARQYYRKLGFRKQGPYMVKRLIS